MDFSETGYLNAVIPGGWGGVLLETLSGVNRPILQILTPFQTKHCHFRHPFPDLVVLFSDLEDLRDHKTHYVYIGRNSDC